MERVFSLPKQKLAVKTLQRGKDEVPGHGEINSANHLVAKNGFIALQCLHFCFFVCVCHTILFSVVHRGKDLFAPLLKQDKQPLENFMQNSKDPFTWQKDDPRARIIRARYVFNFQFYIWVVFGPSAGIILLLG